MVTIEAEICPMQTLLVISVLALLTITGAVFTDRMLINNQGIEQAAD